MLSALPAECGLCVCTGEGLVLQQDVWVNLFYQINFTQSKRPLKLKKWVFFEEKLNLIPWCQMITGMWDLYYRAVDSVALKELEIVPLQGSCKGKTLFPFSFTAHPYNKEPRCCL